VENRIEGAVLVLFETVPGVPGESQRAIPVIPDIVAEAGPDSHALYEYSHAIVSTLHEPAVLLDGTAKILVANEPFKSLSRSNGQLEGRSVLEVISLTSGDESGPGAAEWASLEQLLQDVALKGTVVSDRSIQIRDEPGRNRQLRISARRLIAASDGWGTLILLAASEQQQG
jgi:hypothetical protein